MRPTSHPPTQDAAGIASSLPKPKGNLVSPGIRLGMVPGYQKLGKLTGSPSGTTVVVLYPSSPAVSESPVSPARKGELVGFELMCK